MKEEEATTRTTKSRCVRNYRYELSSEGADADVTRYLLTAATTTKQIGYRTWRRWWREQWPIIFVYFLIYIFGKF